MTVPATPELVVVIGAGSMGQAIARRIGVGKTILLADLNEKAAAAAADTLQGAGFTTSTATVDVASHESVHDLAATASDLGAVTDVVHTAGLSPRRPRRRRSSLSTSSAWPWYWRSSARSSRPAGPAS